jgi:hypothetical protein
MADPTPTPAPTTGVELVAGKVLDALADVLRSAVTPEAIEAQQTLLRRMALEGDVFPSRVPAPRNISEVGGYLNLLTDLGEGDLRTRALAAALGVAAPEDELPLATTTPVLYDITRANDRPAGAAQPTYPVQIKVRNDFAAALDAALTVLHRHGCVLPLQTGPVMLPPLTQPTVDPLAHLGRVLELAPAAALVDPDHDPLALARPDGSTDLGAVARVLDTTAPDAGAVTAQNWVAWTCTPTACTESTASRRYLPLKPILAAAGWYPSTAATPPTSLGPPGPWARWVNVTGLVPGQTKLRDELFARYTPSQVAASSIRDLLDTVWDGTKFSWAPPA